MIEPINQTDSEGRPHGILERYYKEGTLNWRDHYLHGKRHGPSEGYWPNGTLQWREHWLHGKLHGVEEYYWSNDTVFKKTYHLTIK